jgi:hypothetical protein
MVETTARIDFLLEKEKKKKLKVVLTQEDNTVTEFLVDCIESKINGKTIVFSDKKK